MALMLYSEPCRRLESRRPGTCGGNLYGCSPCSADNCLPLHFSPPSQPTSSIEAITPSSRTLKNWTSKRLD